MSEAGHRVPCIPLPAHTADPGGQCFSDPAVPEMLTVVHVSYASQWPISLNY
jgi:hypothetical protein